MHPRTVVFAALLASCTGGPDAQSGTASAASTDVPTTTSDTPTTGDDTDATSSAPTDATSSEVTDVTGEPADILEQLLEIEGLEVEERESPEPGHRYFVLGLDQPADHDAPEALRFTQRMHLLYVDADAPLVLSISGYAIYPDDAGRNELSTLLTANQLAVEHRFFTPSRPDPADWATLTIEQAAADLHRITDAFKPLFPARWLATGVSKGGMTAVYFRRFYPDDVDATVAYVAPHSAGPADPRYLEYVATRGTPECRAALVQTQRELLLRRPAMLARMAAQEVDGYTYELLGADQALETAAVELPFGFWQYGSALNCAAIPEVGASDDALWEFIDAFNSPAYWADHQTLFYEPYFFQAATQLGYPAYEEADLADLLLYPGFDVAASYVLPDKDPIFDPDAMPAIADWIDAEGRALLFIYGENDPYTAAAFAPVGAEDTYVFVAPDENHGAKILDLVPAERDQALAALAAWSGVEPVIPRGPVQAGRELLRRTPR